MCKIWKVVYTCNHTLKLKISICRGMIKHTKVGKLDAHGRPVKGSSACLQVADMYIQHHQECGPCTLKHLEEDLDDEIHALRLRIAPHYSREVRLQAKRQIAEIEESKIEARMTIPKMNWKAPEPIVYGGHKPGQKSKSKERRTGTLLKLEVRPEDVCGDDMYDVVKADLELMSRGWDDKDWGSEVKKLGEELVEDREAAAMSSDEDLEVGSDSGTDSDSTEDEDEVQRYENVDDSEDVINTASDTADTKDSTTLSTANTEFETPPPSGNAYTTTPTITSMTTSPTRPNGPQEIVPSSTETCNPATRGRLADRTFQQIAPTSASTNDNKDGVRFRFGGEEKKMAGSENKKTTPQGGMQMMAMEVVTL